MKRILLLGLPGSGKGVQGKRLAERFGITHVSVGDLVREIVLHNSPLSREIKSSFGKKWSPLPDDLAFKVVSQGIKNLDNFVLDGFPRNVHQAQDLKEIGGAEIAIFLDADEDVCRSRVLARNRDGDSADKFETRLLAERARLPELVEYLKAKIHLITVDANQSEEEVFASIVDNLNKERSQ